MDLEIAHTMTIYMARRMRMLRDHHDLVGMNARLDEIQAAVLRTKMTHLDELNKIRRNPSSTVQPTPARHAYRQIHNLKSGLLSSCFVDILCSA